jgi:hypothetical protein
VRACTDSFGEWAAEEAVRACVQASVAAVGNLTVLPRLRPGSCGLLSSPSDGSVDEEARAVVLAYARAAIAGVRAAVGAESVGRRLREVGEVTTDYGGTVRAALEALS